MDETTENPMVHSRPAGGSMNATGTRIVRQRLADENGPASAEAQALAQLKTQRAQDLQVHCFRVGDTYVTGPLPEATEPARNDDDLLDALKAIQEK